MNPLPWLFGLVFPACGQSGAGGIVPPSLIDLTSLQRSSKPNDALAGPTGKHGHPVDLITPPYALSPAELAAAVRRAVATIPSVYLLADHPDVPQIHYVVRSSVCNFPDMVTVQVVAGASADESFLMMWSRSLYGHYDFKANLRRLHEWLTEIAIETEPLTRKS